MDTVTKRQQDNLTPVATCHQHQQSSKDNLTPKTRVTIRLSVHDAIKLHRLSFGSSKAEVISKALMMMEPTEPVYDAQDDQDNDI